MKKKSVLAILFAIVSLAGFVSPVRATRPEITTFEVHNVVTIDCGGFSVLIDDTFTIRLTIFFNEAGTPTRYEVHNQIRGTVTHSVTGQSLRDHAINNDSGDLPLGPGVTVRGVGWHLVVPGKGVVVLRAGRIVIDAEGHPTFTAGPNIDQSDQEVLCEGLADL